MLSGALTRLAAAVAPPDTAEETAAALARWARTSDGAPLDALPAICDRVLNADATDSNENVNNLWELELLDAWALGDVVVACAVAERDARTLIGYVHMIQHELDYDEPMLDYCASWLRLEVVCGLHQLLRDVLRIRGDNDERPLLRGNVKCPVCAPATPGMRSETARTALEQIAADPLLDSLLVRHDSAACRFYNHIGTDAALVLTTARYGTDAEFRRRCTRSIVRLRVTDANCARRLSRIALAETAMALAGLTLPALLVYEILTALHECCADAGEHFCRQMPAVVTRARRRLVLGQ